ncbi:MAG TPA: double zinc ribbon domain-containing protein, partial [Opitutaceae bacterium]|nr:double zinc ribbon domain-containing protein [Opitutaceae bacterium]
MVFPPVCLACQGLVDEGRTFRHLCSACVASVSRVHAPHCTVCGHPFFGEVVGERTCPHCHELQPEFSTGSTLVLFKGAARALVIELKYQGGLHVLGDIAALVAERPEVMARLQGAVLVPVPLHPRKERER